MPSDHRNRKYTILPYDPTWPDAFAAEVELLYPILGKNALAFEHIGSTAVPGLAGKPTIDVLILVRDISTADRLQKDMIAAGYQAMGDYTKKGGRLFIKENAGKRLRNIHFFEKNNTHAAEVLRVRDYLRSHPDEVRQYAALKMDLEKKFPDDYASYRKHKDEYMIGLLKRTVRQP